MKRSTIALLFGSVILAATSAMADEASDRSDAYYRASQISFTEVVPTAAEIASGYLDSSAVPHTFNPADLIGLDWNQMYVIGEKIIEIIKRGAPVLNIKRDTVAVVPMGVQAWQQLAGWQQPVTKAYNFTIKNYLGNHVVDMRLKVSGMWGGNIDGRGQYLANVQVVPVSVRVLWGWNVDLWSENREAVNTGTVASPIAGLGFDIRYKATTMLNELTGAQDYFITGDGKIVELQ